MKLMVKGEAGQSITEYLILAAVILAAVVAFANTELSAVLKTNLYPAVGDHLTNIGNDASNDDVCPDNVKIPGENAHCVQDDTRELVEEGIGTARQ